MRNEQRGLGMKEVPYFLSLDQAIHLSSKHKLTPTLEYVPLNDAHQRILFEDIKSKVNDPPFDNSAMDGFAVRFEDTNTSPVTLPIVATSQASAGDQNLSLKQGEAIRIMTGAPMPLGADAIIPVELCTVDGMEVTLNEPSKPHFIRKRGENIGKGEVGLVKGTYLTPQAISMCATMGYASLPVVKQLRIGIMCTGDELKTILLSADTDRERISLGVKQLTANKFQEYIQKNTKGSVVKGKILEKNAKHISVHLDVEVIGNLKLSELTDDVNVDSMNIDDELELLITNIDKKNQAISLSMKALEKHQEGEALDQYNQKNESVGSSLGDILKEQIDK